MLTIEKENINGFGIDYLINLLENKIFLATYRSVSYITDR